MTTIPPKKRGKKIGKALQTWDYQNERGEVLLQKRKFLSDNARGKTHDYRSRSRVDFQWSDPPSKWLCPNVDSLLYRLPLLLQAIREGDGPIYWSAGEKDADTLVAHGAIATTHHQGEGWNKVSLEQAEWFRGYSGVVVLCVDEDGVGAADGVWRYELHRGVGIPPTRLRVVRAAGPVVEGRDISDHFDDPAGYGLNDLVPVDIAALMEEADDWDGVSGTSVPDDD